MQQADGWTDRRRFRPQNPLWDGRYEPERPLLGSESAPEPGAEPLPLAGRIPRVESISERKTPRAASSLNNLDNLDNPAESLAAVLHDTRNMVSAIDLYCDLLEEPGVLAAPFRHYAHELRLVGSASRRLLEKLAHLHTVADIASIQRPEKRLKATPDLESNPQSHPETHPQTLARRNRRPFYAVGEQVPDLAEEILANRNLLAALAGPGITLGLSIYGGRRPIAMTREDLTRVLVNLCRNAAEVMPGGGHIQIVLEESPESVSLQFTDTGPGIPPQHLESIFSPGFSTHIALAEEAGLRSGLHTDLRPNLLSDLHSELPSGSSSHFAQSPNPETVSWPTQHRGLGLTIVRSLVSAAGGSVWAANRSATGAAPQPPTHSPTSTVGPSIPDFTPDSKSAVPGIAGAVLSLEFPLPPNPI